jgi:hypothetical protein
MDKTSVDIKAYAASCPKPPRKDWGNFAQIDPAGENAGRTSLLSAKAEIC